MPRVKCEFCDNVIPAKRVSFVLGEQQNDASKQMLCIKCQSELERKIAAEREFFFKSQMMDYALSIKRALRKV